MAPKKGDKNGVPEPLDSPSSSDKKKERKQKKKEGGLFPSRSSHSKHSSSSNLLDSARNAGGSSSSGNLNSDGTKEGNAISRFEWATTKIPPIVEETCIFIEASGYEEEGIFRVTGSFKDINEMKAKYRAGETKLDLSPYSIYSVAGLFTHYFNESQEPLFTFELYPVFIDCMEIYPEEAKIECIRHAIREVPPGPRAIIRYVLKLLVNVASKHELNKMTSTNLATALCPTMLWPKEETIETLVTHQETLTEFFQLLIDRYDDVFLKAPEVLPDIVPDSFRELLQLASDQVKARMPANFTEELESQPLSPEIREIPEEEKPIARVQGVVRGWLLRKKIEKINIKQQIAFNHGIWELMKRESNFVWAMKQAIKDFDTILGESRAGKRIRMLKAKVGQSNESNWQVKLAEAEVKGMIAGFKAIIEVHNMIFDDITAIWNQKWPAVESVGESLLSRFRLFMVYNMYVDMYARVHRLVSAKDANPELKLWMKKETGRAHHSRTLEQLLLFPFQHLSVYNQTLQSLVKCCLEFHRGKEETNCFIKAYGLITRLGVCIDQVERQREEQAVALIEQVIEGLEEGEKIATGYRRLIRQGPVTMSSSAYVFLFNDIAIVTKKTKQETFKFLFDIDLSWNCSIEDNSRFGFILHYEDCDYELITKTADEKVGWFIDFQSVIDHWKNGTFNVSLQRLLERESKISDSTIPMVFKKLSNYILESRLVSPEVVCFVGDKYSVNKLKIQLDQSLDVDLSQFDPVTVISALRYFLLDLPLPLIDREWVRPILAEMKIGKPIINLLVELLLSIPQLHQNLLVEVLIFLLKTEVDHTILAITWSHAIVRSINETVTFALNLPETELLLNLLTNFDAVMDAVIHGGEKKAKKKKRKSKQLGGTMMTPTDPASPKKT